MGLFTHKEKTSPSGFFTTDKTPTDERTESDAINNRPRTSTSSARDANTGARTSQDAARGSHTSSSTGTAAGAGAASAVAAASGAGAAGANRSRSTNDDVIAGSPRSTQATTASYPRTNEQHMGPTGSTALPATAAVAGGAASSPRVAATSPTETRNLDTASTGLPSIGKEDHSSGLTRGATLKEHSAAPHSHHAQPGSDAVLSEEQAKLAEHDHKYLQPVTHERRHIHEVEELERHRVVDRHVHHVQHHVQPLYDERHLETVHSYREVPATHIEEVHANTADDRALLARLNAQSMSTYTVVPHQRVKVDKGETQVVENVINHYHTIVMPVWQRDLHEFYRLNSNFSPATMINSAGGPASSAVPQQQPNIASPSVQTGNFGSAAHPPGASVVPGGPSLFGPPQAREGHKLVPDSRPEVGGESTRYEVEYVNREPVFTASATHPVSSGFANTGSSRQAGPTGAHLPGQGGQGLTSSPSTSRHARTSSLGKTTPGARLPTTTGGHQQSMTGLEQGMQSANLGVAK